MLELEERPLSAEKERTELAAPDKARRDIQGLVQRFARNLDVYTRPDYKETQVRVEFIDPFFEALGWDVRNVQGYAEPYKDVVHEDAIKVSGATKAPDYCFRVGGARKFFLEAKKPSVPVKGEVGPAYQLRRYAWSAKLPLSILTDFEEFAVYDCRQRPKPGDKASVGRVMYLTYQEYLEHLDEIYSIFAREAVLKGSFDRYVEDTRAKRGTGEVDVEFLKEIEGWRDELARDIALRNHDLSVYELNFAVQRTIDRIIFLRMCEDRGIEGYGALLGLTGGPHIYARLGELYREADDKYNSDLFDFRADSLTKSLTLDDKTLQPILSGLYYPDSPYEFSVLPPEILGQVYEQFLGKVIRLTAGHRAKVEEKPEVKKAGGVYYTPSYIVEYIVQQTVGRLIEGKTPQQISKLRILDPACGSGSFLLGAYQRLLDYHRQWYEEHEPKKLATAKRPPVYQGRGGEWRLTTGEKKSILLNNIYGVDIDRQAVEVTKLSLLLRVLEGENQETLGQQLRLWRERALPDLGENIKCGNSLIGPDYFEGQLLPDEEEMRRVNPLDWEKEFPEIMKAGGFDAVIGNPPYVRQEGLGQDKGYYESHYDTFVPTADLYVNFIEQGLRLLDSAGLFGMIVSNKWLRTAYGRSLRRLLRDSAWVLQIVDLAGLPVFAKATVRTLILICAPRPRETQAIRYLAPMDSDEFRTIHTGERLQQLVAERGVNLPVESLSEGGWSPSGASARRLMDRLNEVSVPLERYIGGKPLRGIITGLNKAFMIDRPVRDCLVAQAEQSTEIIRPLVVGRDVRRYDIRFRQRYLLWAYKGVPIERHPAILHHLEQFQTQLEKRWDKGDHWWELRACNYYDRLEQPKIVYPDIATSCRFALDRDGYFASNTTYFIPRDDPYLLGILNSQLGFFCFSELCAGLEGEGPTYLRFFGQYIERFPVRPIQLNKPDDVARHDRMVALVERVLDLHEKLGAATIPADKKLYQRQIESTDAEIDALVYELYGLTEEEIAIVEGREE
jgi:predicted type IV restriction endonuclease